MPIESKDAGFTLAEVLAAMLLMAIVIPVAVGALRVASLSGEVAENKVIAARVADRVLNEAVVTSSGAALPLTGVVTERGRSFNWTLRQEAWPVMLTTTSAMQVVTVNVAFPAQGRSYDVRLSTLMNAQ